MPVLDRDQRRDIDALLNVLKSIDAFLSWLVQESPFIPLDLRGPFANVLPLVRDRLGDARAQLNQIDSTDHVLWKGLDTAGLVGAPLDLKLTIGRRVVSQAESPQRTAKAGIMGRVLRPILGWINTFLGSLATVIPPLELAKEYKEGVELVVDHQQQGEPMPGSIFNLR